MSTKSKLLAMTLGLQVPADIVVPAPQLAAGGSTEVPRFPPVEPRSVPRTGPGQMLQFRGQMLAAENELNTLRDRLKEHEGAAPTKKIDPKSVLPSRWANRHVDSFSNTAFLRLKQDIEQAGGNVQPILVRPLADHPDQYEIVFGHRRHRACAELGLPVLATIDTESISELELFSVMDRENRERADLSPYEQGTMYRRALDQGLYPSNRRLADALGVSHTWVANVLLVADLPPAVLACFSSPLLVHHRHAKMLASAIEQDRKGLLRRAEKLRQQALKLAPAAVVDALMGAGDDSKASTPQSITLDGRVVGKWTRDRAGRLTIQLEPRAAGENQPDEVIVQAIAEALRV